MAYLKHRLDGKVVCLYELSEKTIIGRSQMSNICLDDGTVSARHASLTQSKGIWLLRDLESTNGVMVAGAKIDEMSIEHGLIFNIGTHQFEFLTNMTGELDKTLKIKKSWIPGVFYTE